jgi:hypothetical protein
MGEIDDFVTRWCEAERFGDAEALAAVLHDDFRGIGPFGFVLTKDQWLDRYRQGDLVNDAFTWQEAEVREYGDTAVVVGVQVQTTAYQGRDSSGRFRGALVTVGSGGERLIVHVQLSALAAPPSAPGA